MSVEKHISELLYEHDCVIVPQLGGFVANYAPAKIHPTQHTFIPPSKNIVFNKNLVNNDGLLANHIAISEHTDYLQALRYINGFVTDIHAQLKKGIKVKMSEVGTLYLDMERNIQFEPGTTNYLLDAFGLEEFQSPAIKRDNITKRIEKEFKDRDAIPQEKKKITIKRYIAMAIVLPLIFGMIWIPLKTDLLKGVNYSDLNPFSSKEVAIYTERQSATTLALQTKDFEVSAVLNDKDTSRYITFNLTENSSTPITASMFNTTVEPVKADSTKVVMNSPVNAGLKFHLVTGCFLIHDNAINFVKMLREKSLNAAIIGQNTEGLFVVSCGDFSSRKEASLQLQQLRKIQPKAWLYKN